MPSFIVPLPGGRALAAGVGSTAAKVALTGASVVGNAAAALLTVAPVFTYSVVLQVEAAKSKDVGNMDPLLEVLLGLVNASASTGFGFSFTPRDLYTAIPNAVGVVILVAQLVVFVMHYKPEPELEPEPEYGSDLESLFV